MELKSRDSLSFLLLLLGLTVAAVALPGVDNEAGLNLECTNDFIDQTLCQMERPNCTEYNLTVQSNAADDKEHCSFQQCRSGQCCCSVKLMLVFGDTHTATVRKGDHILESKNINVVQSIKPKAPEIVSVNESNGNFEVLWKTHYDDGVFRKSLTAEVTYYEKGSTENITESLKTATRNGLDFYIIPRGRLKPNTAYMFSVRTFTDWSGMFSDRSREWEFKTSPLHQVSRTTARVVNISLSSKHLFSP